MLGMCYILCMGYRFVALAHGFLIPIKELGL
jgi:hypothetical protein